jgi:hypothetical protein
VTSFNATDICRHCGAEFADHNYVPDSIGTYRCPHPQQETGYGAFKGGNPCNFHPDGECCSDDELKALREAQRTWDGVDLPMPAGCSSPYGIGVYVTYWYEDFSPRESDDDVREEIEDDD